MSNIPAQTQIVNEIELRLKNITKENGYFSTLAKIKRAHLQPFQSTDLPCINYWPNYDNLVQQLSGAELREFTVSVEFYDKNNERPLSDKAAELASDVKIALWRSKNEPKTSDKPNQKLGNLVDSFAITSIEPVLGEGPSPFCGVVVTITIQYRTSDNNPFLIKQ